ncbi:hypothetical protein D0Y65_015907 [Glycine soja]|uniref:NB-ARC domain-containing protein n=1 Tax=Glycine soja TaxID=3848 RepID=A0A445KFC7_GLYSO|nr:hypothetical protein D0Y65_015907 [Glycine soja]
MIKNKLKGRKVLLVLDDVDEHKQLQAIVGKFVWSKSESEFGTRVILIITTRDKQLLTSYGVKRTNEVKELSKNDDIQLLYWKAFKTYDEVYQSYNQVRLKDSEIIFLREKLEEANRQNKAIENRLNQIGQLSVLDNLHITRLSPSHFITVLRHTVRSIINFVRLIVDDMRYAGWDVDATVDAIEHNVVYMAEDHKCFTKMAKRVWLLHCLAFSYEPQASIFQVGKWCIFSDVYMEV